MARNTNASTRLLGQHESSKCSASGPVGGRVQVTAAHHNFTAAASPRLVGAATSPSRISAPGAVEPALRGVNVKRPRFGASHAGGALRRGITPVPAL
jgi:hypothetical protein